MSKIPAYSIKQAAKYLGVSSKTLRRWEAKGLIIPIRTSGGHRRYLVENLNRIKAKRTKKRQANSLSKSLETPTYGKYDYVKVAEGLTSRAQKRILFYAFRAGIIILSLVVIIKAGFIPALTLLASSYLPEENKLRNVLIDIAKKQNKSDIEIENLVNPDLGLVLADSTSLENISFRVGVNSIFENQVELKSDLVLEGTTDNDNETTITLTDPSTDNTITFPDASGEVSLLGQSIDLTTNVTGILPTSQGGTGQDTSDVIDGQLLIGNDAENGFTLANLTAGTGISVTNAAGSISISIGGDVSLLGSSIESSEITDNTIQEIDLEVTNTATDNYVLSYDSATGGFTWVEASEGLFTDGGAITYLTSTTDDLAVGGTTSAAPFYLDVSENDLYLGGIALSAEGTSSSTSGASLIGVYDNFVNISPSSNNVQVVLEALDAQVGAGGSKWTYNATTIHPSTPTSYDLAIGGTDSTAPFFVNIDENDIRIGDGASDANDPTLTFYPSDGGGASTLSLSDADIFTFSSALSASSITDGTATLSSGALSGLTDLALLLGTSNDFTIDAVTTDNTGTTGIINLDLDTTSSQQGINIDAEVIDDNAVDTVAGLYVLGTQSSDDGDNLYGLNIDNLGGTADSGDEIAILVGTGWDDVLNYNGTTLIDGSGNIQAGQISGTLFTAQTDSGAGAASAIARGDTLIIQGDSNGINVTNTGDTLTVAFDGTEVGAETWGTGSGFAWTFDSTANNDPTFTFGSDAFTVGAADTTFSGGNIDVEGYAAIGNGSALSADTGLVIDYDRVGVGVVQQLAVLGNTTGAANTNVYGARIDPESITVPAGTTSLVASLYVDEPNITATGTLTDAASIYIAGAPTEGSTGNYALWVDGGAVQFDGALTLGANGGDGQLVLYNELGPTDYTVTFNLSDSQGGNITYILPPDDGGSNQVLSTNGSGTLTWIDVSAGAGSLWTDGGTTTYLTATSDDLAIGGIDSTSNLFFDESASALTLNPFGGGTGNTGELRLSELAAGGTNYTGFKSPDTLGSNVIYTLPTAVATGANQVLASTTGGVLSWIDVSAGSGGLWIDGGDYIYPTSGEYIGNNTADGANKIAGIYIADDAPLILGTTNDFALSYDATTDNRLELAASNQEFNIALGNQDVVISGSAEGTAALTLTAGDLTISDGDLTVSGGETSLITDSTTDTSKALTISHTGNITGTGYGTYSTVTGTSTANIAGYFNASGATTNYGIITDGANGDIIGSTGSGGDLLLVSTSNATKGQIQFHSNSYYITSTGELITASNESINGIDINSGTVSDVEDLALVLGAGNDFTIDAVTTDNTGTTGIINLDLDTTSSQQAINIDAEVVDDNAVDTVSALYLLATQSSDDGDNLYGLNIDNLGGSAGSGSEIAISIGTGWDTELALADTSPTITIGDTGTLSITDGTNTLLSLADATNTGNLFVSGGFSVYDTAASDGTVEATQFCIGDGETDCVSTWTGAGTNYWSRSGGGVLSPATATDDLAIGGTDSTADFFVSDAGQMSFTPATTGTLVDFILETEWTTGDLINADWASTTSASGAAAGIDLDFTNFNTNAQNVYGLHVNDPNDAPSTNNQYAIYQEGTNWDYGLYVEDQGYFGSNVDISTAITLNTNGITYGQGAANKSSANNAYVDTDTTGTTISRNIADANVALIVQQTNASSTGDILQIKDSAGTRAAFDQDGKLAFTPATTGTFLDFILETEWTTGTLINADFATGPTTLTGAATGLTFDLSTNVTDGNNATTGISLTLPDSGSATSIGLDINGTPDYDIQLSNDEYISNASDNQINLGLGSSGALLLTSSTTASITNSAGALGIDAQATGLNLQADGAIDVNLAGGSGSTGCTIANSTGNLTCSGDITGGATGTIGYWTRSGTTLTPATAGDIVTLGDGGISNYASFNATGDLTFAGTGDTITGPSAGTLNVTAGASQALTLTGNAASTWSTTAGDLSVDSAAGSLNLTSGENVADSIVLSSDAGGIDITTASTEDIDITATGGLNLTSSEADNAAITLTTSNAAGGIDFISSSTTVDALDLTFDSVNSGNGIDLSVDALSTGEGLYVSSTSTALASGGHLALFEWNPGSTDTTDADLFTININSSATVTGHLFVVEDNGTDLFAVDQAKISSYLPHEFLAAGDVSIAYDIQFTNQTSSFIKSNAPLTIQAGESFESNNLTLSTYNSGNIILSPGKATISEGPFSLDAQETFTDSDATPDVSGGSHFITNTTTFTITDFDAGSGSLEAGHLIVIESAGAITYDVDAGNLNAGAADLVTASGDVTTWIYDGSVWNLINWMDDSDTQTGADIAEVYASNQELQPGDVVSIDSANVAYVNKSVISDGSRVIGIVSTDPYLTLGEGEIEAPQVYPIALVGRVPVKISPDSESILPGDLIGASSEAGLARKVSGGYIIGRALEPWFPETGTESINVYVNPIYVNIANLDNPTTGDPLALTGDFISQDETGAFILDIDKINATDLRVLGDTTLGDAVVTGKLNIGTIQIDSSDNSIDAIGTLKIQPLALGDIEIMNGLVTIDTEGNVVAQTITADKYQVAGASAGTATLPNGEDTIYIETDQVTQNSLIFVTPKTTISFPLSVTEKNDGDGFTVTYPTETNKDIEFDWWIVDQISQNQ